MQTSWACWGMMADGRGDDDLTYRIAKGCAAGIIGGFVGSWVMNYVHGLTEQLTEPVKTAFDGNSAGRQSEDSAGETQTAGRTSAESPRNPKSHGPAESQRKSHQQSQSEQEPATVQAASAIAEPVLHRELTESEKGIAGTAGHYGDRKSVV